MLELLPDENKLAVQTRESLRKIHDILGSIHDSDLQLVTYGHCHIVQRNSSDTRKENDPIYT